ncbi:menaquinone biosynthesis protein [Streptomyces kunmingensis]|uniref:Chorismate dehydratase n=1 Tax=Streptomyces kunmingensis TaxID=68225 RepID=A0ABU6CN80_9ACTN|nr:menaquinone biosynthesis protein [Streptomyces kunmingensis]MEB3966178.1 menaquinone biosynthesis protein [Streptomyces kunmingensis]
MKPSGSPRTRLGDISFLNCAPIRWGLSDSGAAHGIDVISAPPERLAAGLLAGDLDISPVSLVRYLRHADDLCLLPGLAIGSDGPVRSCHLVSRGPLEELDGRVVALSEASRSTALLARMLLEDAIGVRPVYRALRRDALGHDPGGVPRTAGAAVVIGDDALRLWADAPGGLTVHDTGEMWRNWTGLPMVFAVWAVRRTFAQDHPDAVAQVGAALTDAVRRARAHPREVAAAAAREARGSSAGAFGEGVLLDYYRALDYSLGDRQLAAIQEFSERAAARGEVPAPLSARIPMPARIPILGGRT